MKSGQYNHTPESKLKGRMVRTLRDLKNGWGVIPRGTIATIAGKQGGFSLQSEPCPCCGMRVSISKVPYTDVELLPIAFDNVGVIPNEGLCLIKIPAADMEVMSAEQVEGIERIVGKATLIIPQDFDVYMDRAAVEELTRIRGEINAVLERG